MSKSIEWDDLGEPVKTTINAIDIDVRRAQRRIEFLEEKLTAEIALVKAMCNAVDWDTAGAKGVGVALHGGSGRPAEPDVKEPEEVPERDFLCCDRPGGHDVPPLQTVPLAGESPSDYWYRQYCLVKQELNRYYR